MSDGTEHSDDSSAKAPEPALGDKWIKKFLQHLAADRGASHYTQRNYRQALVEFHKWNRTERGGAPTWDKLHRRDFRGYLRFLDPNDLNWSAIQLKFTALESIYEYLKQNDVVTESQYRKLKLTEWDLWIEKFLKHLATDRGASHYTERNYEHALYAFRDWQRVQPGAASGWDGLQRDGFRAYLRFLGRDHLSRAAIQLRFSALRSFFKFLIKNCSVKTSPIRNLVLPKLEKRLPKYLTVEQMNDMLEKAEQMAKLLKAPLKPLETSRKPGRGRPLNVNACFRDVAILETIYSCGLRISELCGLVAQDIDWTEFSVRVRGKGKKERQVPIGELALKAIRTYWDLLKGKRKLKHDPSGTAPVFFSELGEGAPFGPRMLQVRLKKYLAAAGLDPHLTPHKLRHTYATLMLDAGADLRSVQELLGHAHLATTQIYTHVTTEKLKRAYDAAHPRAR